MTNDLVSEAKAYFLDLQSRVCAELEKLESKRGFKNEPWTNNAGEGLTCVLEKGLVIERGGVNFSSIDVESLPPSALAHRQDLAGLPFHNTGIAITIHPNNPYAPAAQANLRLFYMERKDQAPLWWFSGGLDLTPCYGFVEDCQIWHQHARNACEPFGRGCYDEFKKKADCYFYNKHRQECRGIGGLFFDDLNRWDFETTFRFVKQVGEIYLTSYLPIIMKRNSMGYGERERTFQLYRRGRYVEFNLIYDKSLLSGLHSGGGRVESLLLSLPPSVIWQYDYPVLENSAEAELLDYYLKPRDWINL